jgi:DNA-binding ferritin-like protein
MNNNEELVLFFLEMINNVKVYHWRTKSYAEHKATDELFSSLNEHVDEFVEILLGKQVPVRLNLDKKVIAIDDYTNREGFIRLLQSYTRVLTGFNEYLKGTDSDLLNIRDEILGDINKTLYLLSLSC